MKIQATVIYAQLHGSPRMRLIPVQIVGSPSAKYDLTIFVSSSWCLVARAMTPLHWLPQGVIQMLGRSRSLPPAVPRRADRATHWAHP